MAASSASCSCFTSAERFTVPSPPRFDDGASPSCYGDIITKVRVLRPGAVVKDPLGATGGWRWVLPMLW